ncbi:MarC family integral membrane protein [uncultured archaeon]|nr:MarC family integral membrane protein [uncultured archaeon]
MDILSLFNFALIIQLFVLIDPLTAFPILMAAYKNKMNIRKIAVSAVLIAFIIAVIIAIFGLYLFDIFGISIDAFRIAGGIVLLLLGIETIRPKQEDKVDIKKTDAIISIIATPLLTGPAIISFVTIKVYEIGKLSVISNILIAFILVAIIFIIFSFFISKINSKVIDIISKILGLFLTAIAIEMIAKGIHGLISAG